MTLLNAIECHWMSLLNVLSVLGVFSTLNVLNVLKDAKPAGPCFGFWKKKKIAICKSRSFSCFCTALVLFLLCSRVPVLAAMSLLLPCSYPVPTPSSSSATYIFFSARREHLKRTKKNACFALVIYPIRVLGLSWPVLSVKKVVAIAVGLATGLQRPSSIRQSLAVWQKELSEEHKMTLKRQKCIENKQNLCNFRFFLISFSLISFFPSFFFIFSVFFCFFSLFFYL